MGNQITQAEECLRMRPWAAVLLSSYSTAGLWLYDQSCTCMFCHFWLSQLHLKHFQNMHCIVSASAGTVSVDYLQASCLLRLCLVLQQEPPRGDVWKEGRNFPPWVTAPLSTGVGLCTGAAWRLPSGQCEIPSRRAPALIAQILFSEDCPVSSQFIDRNQSIILPMHVTKWRVSGPPRALMT